MSPVTPRRWHAELAWLGGDGVQPDVLIEAAGSRFTTVTSGVPAAGCPPGTSRLPGVTLPGLANAHSHAFHRALRGTVQVGGGTFWTWRDLMYQVAARLDPDSYLALARAVYAEMALAGISCVGEFHYLHHAPGGRHYAEENVMAHALAEAATQAGVRITVLDTCYLSGGPGPDGSPLPLAGAQLRFGDGGADAWAERASELADSLPAPAEVARVGAAIHSVRAVPPDQALAVATWARDRNAPLHAHLSEQPAENDACQAAYGMTPTALLGAAGVLDQRFTAVHATHLRRSDIDLLGRSGGTVCLCPTTEADLADGIGPARALADTGCRLSLGSDSHAVIDILEEARRLELGERLASGRRGAFGTAELARSASVAGHACLGWPDAGVIAAGAAADLVTVALDTPRLAGARPGTALESVIFAATAADVRGVVVNGRDVVADGSHLLLPDVPAALTRAITPLLS